MDLSDTYTMVRGDSDMVRTCDSEYKNVCVCEKPHSHCFSKFHNFILYKG